MKCNHFIILCISAFLLYVIVSQSYKEGLALGPNPLDVLSLLGKHDDDDDDAKQTMNFMKSPEMISCIQKQMQILLSASDIPRVFQGFEQIIPAIPLLLDRNIDNLKIVQTSDYPNSRIEVKDCKYDGPLPPEMPANMAWSTFPKEQIEFITKSISDLQPEFNAVVTSAEKNKNLDPAFTLYVKYLCNNIQELWNANSKTLLIPGM